MKPSEARRLINEPDLFADRNQAATAYQFDPDFRNQIKGRLLAHGILTQIVRESTLTSRFSQQGRQAHAPLGKAPIRNCMELEFRHLLQDWRTALEVERRARRRLLCRLGIQARRKESQPASGLLRRANVS